MTISEIIAKNAKYICEKQGKRVGDLERGVGVSLGYLSRIRGKKMISVDLSYKIVNWLGIDMARLMDAELAKRSRIEELERELKELRESLE